MPDQRIQYTEELVGAGHPTKADTLNRLALVEHNDDGSHGNVNITGGLTLAPGVWPSFAAHKTADQSIAANTWTKVVFDVEDWDTNNDFDLANSRFQPTVAGRYLICSFLGMDNFTALRHSVVGVYKNGALWKQMGGISGTRRHGPHIAVLVDMNGSTDYVEIYGWVVNESGRIPGSPTETWVQGTRIG